MRPENWQLPLPKPALPGLARIMRGIKLAGAGLARERDQMLGDDPGGDDFLDSTFLQARPSKAPESRTIVGQRAELPAHLEQHGEAPLHVPESELARPRWKLAAMRIGAADLIIVAAEQPHRIVGMLQAGAPDCDRLIVRHLEDDVRFTVGVIAEPVFAFEAVP